MECAAVLSGQIIDVGAGSHQRLAGLQEWSNSPVDGQASNGGSTPKKLTFRATPPYGEFVP
jgi:hypothetical protein